MQVSFLCRIVPFPILSDLWPTIFHNRYGVHSCLSQIDRGTVPKIMNLESLIPTFSTYDEVKKQSWYSIFNEEFLADCASKRGVAARFGQADDIGVSPNGPFKQDDDWY